MILPSKSLPANEDNLSRGIIASVPASPTIALVGFVTIPPLANLGRFLSSLDISRAINPASIPNEAAVPHPGMSAAAPEAASNPAPNQSPLEALSTAKNALETAPMTGSALRSDLPPNLAPPLTAAAAPLAAVAPPLAAVAPPLAAVAPPLAAVAPPLAVA